MFFKFICDDGKDVEVDRELLRTFSTLLGEMITTDENLMEMRIQYSSKLMNDAAEAMNWAATHDEWWVDLPESNCISNLDLHPDLFWVLDFLGVGRLLSVGYYVGGNLPSLCPRGRYEGDFRDEISSQLEKVVKLIKNEDESIHPKLRKRLTDYYAATIADEIGTFGATKTIDVLVKSLLELEIDFFVRIMKYYYEYHYRLQDSDTYHECNYRPNDYYKSAPLRRYMKMVKLYCKSKTVEEVVEKILPLWPILTIKPDEQMRSYGISDEIHERVNMEIRHGILGVGWYLFNIIEKNPDMYIVEMYGTSSARTVRINFPKGPNLDALIEYNKTPHSVLNVKWMECGRGEWVPFDRHTRKPFYFDEHGNRISE